MKKKILLLFCGGTIVMEKNEAGALAPPQKERALQLLIELEPQITTLVELDLIFIANIDSTNILPELWDTMAETVFQNYEKYDGFVITHGTDTMAYSASALSFALEGLKKPVVFTGAQIPGSYLESDARRNFVNAIRTVLLGIPAVMIAFSEKILLGVRASKVSHTKLDAFASISYPTLASIGTYIRVKNKAPKRQEKPLALRSGFDSQIAVVSLVPGMPLLVFEEILRSDVHAIILIAYGSGNIPKMYLPFLEKALKRKLPVVIRTQCLEGSTSMKIYETGKRALQYNVIEVYDMNLETSITKLMWALKHANSYREVKRIMQTNYAGEISL